MTLSTDSKERKNTPITTGVLDYFPDAIAAIARVSFIGNEQHNPGEPLHWAREKSTDHADCIARHLLERGKTDTDGTMHSAKMAWRALALLQIEIEKGRANTPPEVAEIEWIEPLTDARDTRLTCAHNGYHCFHVDYNCAVQGHVAPCAWAKPGRVLEVRRA